MSTFGDLTVEKVDQSGPPNTGQFTYVDISSIDNKQKRIVEPKRLPASKAPSRAKQRLQPGDVLVSMTRPNLNAVAIVPSDLAGSVGSTGFHVLRAIEGIEPRWLFYAVQRRDFIEAMSMLVQGALYPAVRPKDIKAFGIDAPPLGEQQRIVAEIEKQFSRLDEAVANLKRVKANLKRYKAAVLKAAVEGKLTEEWRKQHPDVEPASKIIERIVANRRTKTTGRGRFKAATVLDTTDLPKLPYGWTWIPWELALSPAEGAFKRGPFGSALTKAIFVSQGYKVYEQYCPINDDCSFGRYYITPEKFEELRAFEVKAGDFLISCSGVTLGRITQVPHSSAKGIINQALLRVRLNKYVIDDAYFLRLFRSPVFQKRISDTSTGTAIPNVKGVKELKAIPIPLPPLVEQQHIVAEVARSLSVIEELETSVDANLSRSNRIRQAILGYAFTGQCGQTELYATAGVDSDLPIAAEGKGTYGRNP